MIHDTPAQDIKEIMPTTIDRDNLAPATRRINQNVEIISVSEIAEVTATGIGSGQTSILNLEFTNVQNDGPCGAFWEITVFVNTRSTANILYPYHNQSVVDLSQWQIMPLGGALIPDGVSANADQTLYCSKMTFRNISAGSVNLIVQARCRYIFNRG